MAFFTGNARMLRTLILALFGCIVLVMWPASLPFETARAYACNGGGNGSEGHSHGDSSSSSSNSDGIENNPGMTENMGPVDHRHPPAGFDPLFDQALNPSNGPDPLANDPAPDLTSVVQSLPPDVHTIDTSYVDDAPAPSTGSVGPTEVVEYLEPMTEEQWEAAQTFLEIVVTFAGSHYIGSVYVGWEAIGYSAAWGAGTTLVRSDGDLQSSASSAIQDSLIAASGAPPEVGALASEALGQVREQIPERPSLTTRQQLERMDDPRSRALQ